MTRQYELLSLKQVFGDGQRRFVIPDYQRGYSWEKRQRQDLLGDIDQLRGSDYRHFTGTIVASKRDDSPDVYEVVDGQQRLTSLVLLIAMVVRRVSHLEPAMRARRLVVLSGQESGNTVQSYLLS